MANRKRLRNIWRVMKFRCSNPKSSEYSRYGLRGITVCERWQNFENFLLDMGSTYQDGLSIDRVNNDLGYSPQNCRWATAKMQARNRRSTRLFEGKTLSEWAEVLGVKRSTLAQRLYVYKWSIDKCLGGVQIG